MPEPRQRTLLALGFPESKAVQIDDILTDLARAAVAVDAERALDPDCVKQLSALGIGAVRLEPADGGLGFSLPALFELLALIAHADSNLTQILRAHFIATEEFLRDSNRGADVPWLREIACGAVFGNATTELGSHQAGTVNTRITSRADGKYSISGTKFYATGSAYADWIQVLAADENGSHYNVTVDRFDGGVAIDNDWDGFGQRATVSGSARFDGAVVEEHQLCRIDADSDPFTDTVAQLVHLSTMVGIGARLLDDVTEQVRSRERHYSHASGTTAAGDAQVQEIIGRGIAAVSVSKSSVRSAAEATQDYLDAHRVSRSDSTQLAERAHHLTNHAQVVIAPLLLALAGDVFEVGGASLLSSRIGLDRHWRNLRTLASHNPATFKARVLGESALLGTSLPSVWYSGRRE